MTDDIPCNNCGVKYSEFTKLKEAKPYDLIWAFFDKNKDNDVGCKKLLELRDKNSGKEEDLILLYINTLKKNNDEFRKQFANHISQPNRIIQPNKKIIMP